MTDEKHKREGTRQKAFGQDHKRNVVDRFGFWLSEVKIRRSAGGWAGKAVADVGCGFEAPLARAILAQAASVTLVDLALADDLKADPRVTAIEGVLPDALERIASASLDVVVCNNVLEHLWRPQAALGHFRRVLRDGGVALLNVPSWRGKYFLELGAFRLHVVPEREIDDHKHYYSPREFWSLLVESGFRPIEIERCHTHKFGLNTYATCRVRSAWGR
jgi:2-polyprenyl-3-methyl-5-hydroxy-6-metoxy-1,4-benzoquinol methylase